jgi:hypothetical protein
MSERFSDEMLEDFDQDEAEGAADGHEEEFEAGEEGDEFLGRLLGGAARVVGGMMGGGGGDGFDEGEEFDEGEDEFDAGDEFEEGEVDLEAFDEAAADALGAEDTDEFFRRLGRIARSVGRGVGRVARVVAPIASAIPTPWTQAIGRVAQVAGRVLADGGDEFDALEEAFDYAESEDSIDAAAPVLAALTLRSRMPGISAAPRAVRQQLVRSVSQATRRIAQQQGPRAARAVPGVVQRVQRAVRSRAIPARRAPQAVTALARRAAANPRTAAALARQARASGPATSRRRRHRRRHGHGMRHRAHGGAGTGAAGGVGGYVPGSATRAVAGGACACGRNRPIVVRGPTNISVFPR